MRQTVVNLVERNGTVSRENETIASGKFVRAFVLCRLTQLSLYILYPSTPKKLEKFFRLLPLVSINPAGHIFRVTGLPIPTVKGKQ